MEKRQKFRAYLICLPNWIWGRSSPHDPCSNLASARKSVMSNEIFALMYPKEKQEIILHVKLFTEKKLEHLEILMRVKPML